MRIIEEKSAGKAFPTTEITPSAPNAIIGSARPSSPEINRKSFGLFLMISINCSKLPEASFIPMIFESSAKRKVV
ncbi:hypothetical protein D3C86_1600400 [compost metagenome]